MDSGWLAKNKEDERWSRQRGKVTQNRKMSTRRRNKNSIGKEEVMGEHRSPEEGVYKREKTFLGH